LLLLQSGTVARFVKKVSDLSTKVDYLSEKNDISKISAVAKAITTIEQQNQWL
jgi:hypothetical protein